MLDNFMRQLSKELDVNPPLEPLLPGVYEYFLEEDLCVTITAITPQGFSLSCTFGEVPKAKEQEFHALMLNGNLFGKETFGATLGLDEEGKRLRLSRVLDTRMEYREFKETLEDFFNIIDFWQEQVLQQK